MAKLGKTSGDVSKEKEELTTARGGKRRRVKRRKRTEIKITTLSVREKGRR